MNSVADPVRTYLLGLREGLEDLANVTVREHSVHPRDPALSVEIVPASSKSATICLHMESANQVDLDLGFGSHFELYAKDPRELVDQLKEIIEAVENGRFEETVWRRSGRIAKAKGTLNLADDQRPITIRYWSLGALLTLGRSERIHRRYEPYRSPPNSS